MKRLLVCALVVAAATAQTFYRLPAPYTYTCTNSLCIKQEVGETREYRSLETCQLTCGKYGALWPQPTGEVQLSSETVNFSPKNIRVSKLAATNPKVSRMLERAVNYFTRNIHFLHPDFPSDKKSPILQEERFNTYEEQDFDGDYQQVNVGQQRFRHEQIRPSSIDHHHHQQQQQQFSVFNEETAKYLKYSPFLKERSSAVADNQALDIAITVSSPEEKLNFNTDESYDLVVQTTGKETTVTILARSYYGARHALDTLGQLIAFDENTNSLQIVTDASIQDEPKFKYRGVMLDTGRNFYPKEDIMSFLDAMSYNKMNYFHWHIVDSASFPMYSNRQPKMAYFGAYSPRKVYYPEDINEIVEYAQLRGINVIPELDGPAHTAAGWQWGPKEGKGNLVLCVNKEQGEPWFEMGKEPPSGQFNPVNPELYPILGEIYKDMMDYFDPTLIHMGGDDVSFKCWQNSDEIKEYMASRNLEPGSQQFFELWNTYQQTAYSKLQEASGPYRTVTPIIHSSSFALNYADKDAYIIQLNELTSDNAIAEYIKKGFKVIFSNQDQWRLDCPANQWYGDKAESCSAETPTWRSFYDNSPLDVLEKLGLPNARSEEPGNAVRENVLGGEATLWSFNTDANSFQAKMWPRVSAMAERLWTDPVQHSQGVDTIQKRFNTHRQRMVNLGIRADPVQPEYCMHDESACYSEEQYRARSGITPQ